MRKALSKRTRFEVFKRDGFRCMYCGQRPPEVVLVIDHVVPVCEGGGNEADNLTTSCYACNAGKGPVPLGEVKPQLDELAVLEAMQEVAERSVLLRQQVAAVESQKKAVDEAIDRVFMWWADEVGHDYIEAFDESSIRTFIRLGREPEEVFWAMTRTSAWLGDRNVKPWKVWKYFCGVMWRKIKGTWEEPL